MINNEEERIRKSETSINTIIGILEKSVWFNNIVDLKSLFKDSTEDQIKTFIKLQIVQMIEAGYNQGAIDTLEDIKDKIVSDDIDNINKKSNSIDIKIHLPENQSIDIAKQYGGTGDDPIINRCYISGIKIDSVYIAEGDNMPDKDGFIRLNGPIATASDVGKYLDVWFPVHIASNGYCHPDVPSVYGTITANICLMIRQDAKTCKEINDTLYGEIYKNTINIQSGKDIIKEIMLTVEY